MTNPEKLIMLILIIVASLLPPVTFYIFSSVPTVSPKNAIKLINNESDGTVLLDVRKKSAFEQVHVYPSINVSYDEILEHGTKADLMNRLEDKKVMVLSSSGIQSIEIVKRLRRERIDAYNIKGGFGLWIANSGKISQGLSSVFIASDNELSLFRVAPLHEQWLAVLTGYGIKPLYTLLSFIIMIVLWKRSETELIALKYSMLSFFVGENFCAVNYLFYQHESYLFEYFHSLGMVICFGFATYALFHGADKYILHYSNQTKKCVFLGLCDKCVKYESVPCALWRIFLFICFTASVLSLMPLFANLKMVSYNTEIWKTLYNYSHPVIYQIFEIRYCPIIATIAFFSAGLILLLRKADKLPLVKIIIAAAAGSAGFSFFRFILFHAYQDNLVWMEFWEEITEFMFISGLVFLLWQFRVSLLKRQRVDYTLE